MTRRQNRTENRAEGFYFKVFFPPSSAFCGGITACTCVCLCCAGLCALSCMRACVRGCFGGAWESGWRFAGADHQQDELCHRGGIRAPALFDRCTKYIKTFACNFEKQKDRFPPRAYESRERDPALRLCAADATAVGGFG